MEWQTEQVMPAWAVEWLTVSNFGSSKAPLKNGTGSWQPAHHREACTLPSRFSDTSRVSVTLARYGALLNELKRWTLSLHWACTSAWYLRQYWSFMSAAAGMK